MPLAPPVTNAVFPARSCIDFPQSKQPTPLITIVGGRLATTIPGGVIRIDLGRSASCPVLVTAERSSPLGWPAQALTISLRATSFILCFGADSHRSLHDGNHLLGGADDRVFLFGVSRRAYCRTPRTQLQGLG